MKQIRIEKGEEFWFQYGTDGGVVQEEGRGPGTLTYVPDGEGATEWERTGRLRVNRSGPSPVTPEVPLTVKGGEPEQPPTGAVRKLIDYFAYPERQAGACSREWIQKTALAAEEELAEEHILEYREREQNPYFVDGKPLHLEEREVPCLISWLRKGGMTTIMNPRSARYALRRLPDPPVPEPEKRGKWAWKTQCAAMCPSCLGYVDIELPFPHSCGECGEKLRGVKPLPEQENDPPESESEKVRPWLLPVRSSDSVKVLCPACGARNRKPWSWCHHCKKAFGEPRQLPE